jgi:hypothetical protein
MKSTLTSGIEVESLAVKEAGNQKKYACRTTEAVNRQAQSGCLPLSDAVLSDYLVRTGK